LAANPENVLLGADWSGEGNRERTLSGAGAHVARRRRGGERTHAAFVKAAIDAVLATA
jgi:hypothetical protein